MKELRLFPLFFIIGVNFEKFMLKNKVVSGTFLKKFSRESKAKTQVRTVYRV